MDRLIITILTIFSLLTGCNKSITFDKYGWIIQDDLGLYPNRDKMLDDLTKNQKLEGLTYNQLIDKLGHPVKYSPGDSNTIYYEIVTDYGHDIDPVYIKTLEFKFDNDSIIKSFKINETQY